MNDGNGILTTMPVTPTYGGGGGFGGFGGDWGWIILLLLFAGGGFGGYGGGYGAANYDFPWVLNGQQTIMANTNGGFRDAMINDGITSIRDGLSGISTQLCNSFASVEQSANARQMADMQSMFNIQSSLQNCCCENRANIADLKYTVATENCADRQALSDGVRNVIENCNRNNQAILDKICQLELDAKQDKINDLERQLSMASLSASQTAQTAQLIADNTAQTQYIVNRVAPYPIPAYVVANPVTPAVYE